MFMGHATRLVVTVAAAWAATCTVLPAEVAGQELCEGPAVACQAHADCTSLDPGQLCIDGACAHGCPSEHSADCSLGETCVAGRSPRGEFGHYCQPSRFSVDINLLDSCLYHFIEGISPDLDGADACAVENRLDQVLDRNGDRVFDIYDVDRCIKDFIDEEPCDVVNETCPDRQVFCASDAECGPGLHCNGELHRCERECGLVTDRRRAGDGVLERECAGALKVCEYDRGECVTVDLAQRSCEVDRDCPNGAYCLVGACQPLCGRSLDCPSDAWECRADNRCAPRPRSIDPDQPPFEPGDHAVLFAEPQVSLDELHDTRATPVLIMNKQTKRQVFDAPNVLFGYRLELRYARKQSPECLGDLSLLTPAQQAECIISPDEEFVTLDHPFGVLTADGNPVLNVRLNRAAAAKLGEGSYEATLTAIFSNGSRTSTTVSLQKLSVSGEYAGRMSVYLRHPDNLIGSSNVTMRLFVDRKAPLIAWDSLLRQNNVPTGEELRDVTEGYPVTGVLHGNDTMLFDQPFALTAEANEIPVKGIYSERLGRLRLIALIELNKDHCRSEDGLCRTPANGQLQSKNPFERKIRRVLEWVGPLDTGTRRFDGMYRETIHGLLPHAVSLSGGFMLSQLRQDERALALGPLLPSNTAVGFPKVTGTGGLLEELARRIRTSCGAAGLDADFASRDAYRAYLGRSYDQQGPVLGDLVSFEDRVQTALDNMEGSGAALTLADYFRGEIEFCDERPGASCVDRKKLECGLALYQKALLAQDPQGRPWVDLGVVGDEVGAAPAPALFCRQPAGRDDVCTLGAAVAPTLVTLQEHNRFYRELTQTYSYEALNALSDAFYILYKAQHGSALDGDSAFQHKQASLVSALENYQHATSLMVTPASVAVMAQWPMREFATVGRSWIAQMHATASDRMEAVISLVDLRRRILRDVDAADALFAQHLMHVEYLHQVFLAALEEHWEGDQFAYEGQGPEMLVRGEVLLAKTQASRNPLGLHPNRVYFENSRLELSNWQALRERVTEGNRRLHDTVNLAIDEMKRALRDKDSLLSTLLTEEQQIAQTMDELCGPDVPLPSACVDTSQPVVPGSCQGEQCLFKYRCAAGEDCSSVARYYNGALSEVEHTACRAGTEGLVLQVQDGTLSDPGKIDIDGAPRWCVRGRMGTLLQERAALQLQREQVTRQVRMLLAQAARHQAQIALVNRENQQLRAYMQQKAAVLRGLDAGIEAAQLVERVALESLNPMGCLIIIGLAGGSDCPGRIARAVASVAVLAASAGTSAMRVVSADIEREKDIEYRRVDDIKELEQLRVAFDDLVAQVESQAAQYEQLTQQLFNVNVQIRDTHYLAERSVGRYKERLGDLVDRLVGRETGSVLVRNGLIREAEAQFQEVLLDSYKMTQAFVHRYNEAEREHGLQNAAFQLSSAQDVDRHVDLLTRLEDRYCGAQGIDCDAVHNRKVFAYSLRKNLFPDLRDIVDANTGAVRTAGQQFHDLLMGPLLQRRARASGVRSQIEIPFHIWLNKGGTSGGRKQPYLVNGEECNHILVSDRANNSGTVAVNVIGTRLGGGQQRQITYELWRGGSDHIRSCSDRVSRDESKVNVYTVGWSPYHAFGQSDSPPSFQTHSDGFFACKNDRMLADPAQRDQASSCFNFFARDRSLAAPDWKLVIPFVDNEQSWLTGEGLPEHERPIVEDIVVYFRYNARPIVVD